MRIGYQLNAKPNRSFIRSALIANSKKFTKIHRSKKINQGIFKLTEKPSLRKLSYDIPKKLNGQRMKTAKDYLEEAIQ